MLHNIKEKLLRGTTKLTSVSPDLIEQIYAFENLNDFTKTVDLDEIFNE